MIQIAGKKEIRATFLKRWTIAPERRF